MVISKESLLLMIHVRLLFQKVNTKESCLDKYLQYEAFSFIFRDGTWNCDKCKADVGAVGTLLVSDDATNAAVEMLQGKDFCQDPGMGLSGDDIKTCQTYIGKYIPPIMQHMFNGLGDHAELICTHMFHLKC